MTIIKIGCDILTVAHSFSNIHREEYKIEFREDRRASYPNQIMLP